MRNRPDVVRDLLDDRKIDIMCLTETWHDDAESQCIRRLRTSGRQVIERARPVPPGKSTDSLNYVNHGGVAIVAPTSVKLSCDQYLNLIRSSIY